MAASDASPASTGFGELMARKRSIIEFTGTMRWAQLSGAHRLTHFKAGGRSSAVTVRAWADES